MSDQRARADERAAVTGDVEAEAKVIAARLRRGELAR
jgi:hypothetical protein